VEICDALCLGVGRTGLDELAREGAVLLDGEMEEFCDVECDCWGKGTWIVLTLGRLGSGGCALGAAVLGL
jgi:hypothetical protein